MAYLGTDIIQGALRLIGGGTFASGETPSASETADALLALNLLLETWSNEQLTIYQVLTMQFNAGGIQTYQMGPGGTWVTASRPVKIQNPGVIINGIRHELHPASPAEWSALPEKGLTGLLPRVLWNDNAFPLVGIHLSPIPSQNVIIEMLVWQALQQFATAGDSVALPPAYMRALTYNLAIDLAPQYGAAVPDAVAEIAQSSKQAIITLNTSNALGNLPSDLPQPDAQQQ